MIDNTSVFKIKDSLDLFLTDQTALMVYSVNTRQRKCFRISEATAILLECIDGIHDVAHICKKMARERNIDSDSVYSVLENLLSKRIITKCENCIDTLPKAYLQRYERQINYFSEFCGSLNEGILAQKRVVDSSVLIFGCGAVGGTIAIELTMAGIENITLFDDDVVEENDTSRHTFFRTENIGKKKVEALKDELLRINSSINVKTIDEYLKPDSLIEKIIKQNNFVVNTLDEPYIGYTSAKISRICVKHRIAHYIAGGFDAHLASTGELIIPYVTPCVECYAKHFKVALKNWKPQKHPVSERRIEIGGLASMSLFSSSYACVEILKFLAGIVDLTNNYKARGEFLFDDFSLSYLNIKRNNACPICGEDAIL
jgi:molybdopterin/thiamine biosynthesis adenylyltransferase